MIKPGTICWITNAGDDWNEWGMKIVGTVVTVLRRVDSRGREAYEVNRMFKDDDGDVTDLVERRHLIVISGSAPENPGTALRQFLRLEAK